MFKVNQALLAATAAADDVFGDTDDADDGALGIS